MELTNENRRLGEEKISRLLFKFSVPCVMGLLISAFYNIVDQIFIGNSELGFLGNAATGVSILIICIANAFAWCVGDGAASYLSICSSRNDSQSAHKCVGTGITVTALISLVLMIAMLVGAVTNIILDPIFIFLLKWGIAGAAWATVIGQILSFLTCAVYFFKPKSFKLTRRSFLPDQRILMNTVALGASTFVTHAGSCVIVGCAADYVLREYDNVVSVFFHAPKEFRIQNIMEMYGDSLEEAAANIRHSDAARSAYYWNISGQHWNNPYNYDICLDASMGRQECADLVLQLLSQKSE